MASHFDIDDEGFVNVWTDGACLGNGQYGASAGIGVWFGDNHRLNVSRPIPTDYRSTNQVAEILAVTEAARVAKRAGVRNLMINTDSKFIISCVDEWIPKWKRNGWRKADGGEVVNKQELLEMDCALRALNAFEMTHVVAHADDYGNKMADQLARAGASEAKYAQ